MNLEAIRNRLVLEEGLKLKPYHCTANKLTIGVGRNIQDRGISNETAMQMLDEDIDIMVNELRTNLPWFDKQNDAIQGVLIDLCFNMGISRLLLFVQTLSLIEKGQYAMAADELLDSKYAAMLPARSNRNAEILRAQ